MTPEDAKTKLEKIAAEVETVPAIINESVSQYIEREFGDVLRRIEFAGSGLAEPGSVEAQENKPSSQEYIYDDGKVRVRLPERETAAAPPPPDPKDRAKLEPPDK